MGDVCAREQPARNGYLRIASSLKIRRLRSRFSEQLSGMDRTNNIFALVMIDGRVLRIFLVKTAMVGPLVVRSLLQPTRLSGRKREFDFPLSNDLTELGTPWIGARLVSVNFNPLIWVVRSESCGGRLLGFLIAPRIVPFAAALGQDRLGVGSTSRLIGHHRPRPLGEFSIGGWKGSPGRIISVRIAR